MPNPKAAMLVIGDEILSGRTRESNAHHLAGRLGEIGMDLREIRVIPDDANVIEAAVREISETFDHVFTSGGIGPTHDDITADCVAAALGASISVREDARAILQAHYDQRGTDLNEARMRMARIPEGAVLIDNPVSAAPGFSLGNVHVMAGVPRIFEAMVAALLPSLTGGARLLARTLRVERAEGDIAGVLGEVAAAHPDLMIGSYPTDQGPRPSVQMVLRGADPQMLESAVVALRGHFPEAVE